MCFRQLLWLFSTFSHLVQLPVTSSFALREVKRFIKWLLSPTTSSLNVLYLSLPANLFISILAAALLPQVSIQLNIIFKNARIHIYIGKYLLIPVCSKILNNWGKTYSLMFPLRSLFSAHTRHLVVVFVFWFVSNVLFLQPLLVNTHYSLSAYEKNTRIK